jgi:hypothetical protein
MSDRNKDRKDRRKREIDERVDRRSLVGITNQRAQKRKREMYERVDRMDLDRFMDEINYRGQERREEDESTHN